MDSVIVLMATYNGEKYLEKQIESVMQQRGVQLRLYIRDDGSSDHTIDILKKMKVSYGEQLHLEKGEHIGYRRGFRCLMEGCGDADYYAFCDQDDVWHPDKISRAIGILSQKNRDSALLYASAMYMTDCNLQKRTLKKYDMERRSLKGNVFRASMAGCTFVFNRKLLCMVNGIDMSHLPDCSYPSHDALVSTCAYALGEVVVDDEAFIWHRRHENCWGADGCLWGKRIRTELWLIFCRKNTASIMAARILERYAQDMKPEDRTFLEAVAGNLESAKSRWNLIRYPGFRIKNKLLNAVTYFKILIGTY